MKQNMLLTAVRPAVLTSLLLLIMGGGAGWYVSSLQSEVTGLTARSIRATRHSEELLLALRDVRVRLLRYLQSSDATFLKVALEREEARRLLDEVAARMTSRDSQSLVTNIQQQTDILFRQLAEVLNQPDSGGRRDDVRRLVDGLLDTMIRDVEQLHAVNLETLAASRSRLLTVGDKVAWGLLALGICGAVSGLLAGFSVARKVVTQLASSEQAVMRADQLASMGQLAAGLAHEVRNPLMIMRLLIDTAAPNQSGRIEGRDLAVLDQEISRLEILVESFSDFARPPQPEPVEFDVQGMLSEIEQLTDATALQNDVTMQIEASAGPLLIYADRGQLRQLVLNLVINAINAQSDGGSIRLAAHRASAGIPVSLRQQVDDPGILRLSVTDTGPGIAADLTDQVFEPFYSTRETGLGLGLSICRRIVESHGGLIDVEHDGDVGAKFIVWLPLRMLPAGNRDKKDDHGESADHR